MNIRGAKIYFDKNVIFSVSRKAWQEFWKLARMIDIRGYYSPIALVEITSGLFDRFEDHRRCFEKIAQADLGLLRYSELVIVEHMLGSHGVPQGVVSQEQQIYTVFRSVPDFVLTYCKSESDLRNVFDVNKNNCPRSVRNLIDSQRTLKSCVVTVAQAKEGPWYRLTFDLTLINEFRKRYEERWLYVMRLMREIVMTDLTQRAERIGKSQLDRQSVIDFFRSNDFVALFAEATLDRAAGFVYDTQGPFWRTRGAANKDEMIGKIRRLDAFYEFYKRMIIAEITGGSQKNDHNDLHQLVYLADGFYFITNDRRLQRRVASSSQGHMVMSFQHALELLQENVQ